MINVEKITKVIKGKDTLKNISFKVEEGECVALIGPNGAGKSTLIGTMLGDKKINQGKISIQSKNPKDPVVKEKLLSYNKIIPFLIILR